MNMYYCRLMIDNIEYYKRYVQSDSALETLIYLEGIHYLPKGKWVIDCVYRGDDDLDRGAL